ncbi:sensor histidine kinase [Streptomyces prasinus]|uniref:histidine kinase n=1 Tax=Streptomyces prasinus TaxID=67345 RepID=A0ABX6B5Z4_9ACTN|nr:histidine kinase [Streptomyces prasinus]QEV09692.1 sensor histidine kinase [Streptomyces prasinus]
MGKIRGRLLPGLFAVAQLVLWCFTVPTREKPPGVTEWIVVLSATAFTTVALARRTRAPLHALGGILAVSVLVQLLTPPDTVALVSGLAVLMALFSVTTLSDWAVSLGATAVTAVVQLLPIAMKSGSGGTFLHEWLTAVSMYLVVSALGAGRRHRLRERQVTKQRLTRAEQERGQAAGTERDRLANELHDISAHHLTSVVVSVEAARRLGDTRPELAAEALTFASRTAHETQSALRRLVAVMRVDDVPAPQSMTPAIEALIAGFGRLGRPVSVSLPADLAGPAAEAAHGIIREALTNALRYAPGASIGIRAERSEDALDLTIDNGKPPKGTGSHRLGIGSGRGVEGMHRRATALGGQLSAGPRPDGGWRVHAVLPDARSPRQPATGNRRNYTREQRIADVAVFGSITLTLLGYALNTAVEHGHGVALSLSLALLLTVHALPLLWRRRAPWLALAAVGATTFGGTVLLGSGVLPGSAADSLVGGGLVEVAAVYGVAAYGRVLVPATAPAGRYVRPSAPHVTHPHGNRLSYLPVPAMTLSFGVSTVGAFAGDGMLGGEPVNAFELGFSLITAVMYLGPLFTAAWLAGWLMHMRRRRELGREDATLTALVWITENTVHSERQRVAAGLQETVLQQTTQVISAAETGSLDAVAAATRATLAAMRELLRSLDVRSGQAVGIPDGRMSPLS